MNLMHASQQGSLHTGHRNSAGDEGCFLHTAEFDSIVDIGGLIENRRLSFCKKESISSVSEFIDFISQILQIL